jgi:S1-C subfamily serine protease
MSPPWYAVVFMTTIALSASALEAQVVEVRPVPLANQGEPRASLGYRIRMVPGPNNEYTHPVVVNVAEGSNAERAGLRNGDVLLAVDDRDTRSGSRLYPDVTPGTRYTLRVRRDGEELALEYIFPSPPEGGTASGPAP